MGVTLTSKLEWIRHRTKGSRQMTQLVYANFNVIMYNEHSMGMNSSISILLTH